MLLLIVELLCFVPYQRIEIIKSKQNVPHTEIIGNGYSTIIEISNSYAKFYGNSQTATGKRVDTPQIILNAVLTTLVAAAIYFLFILKKETPVSNQFDNVPETAQLQRRIDELSTENASLLKIKKQYEQFISEKNIDIRDTPELDINALTFATEEEVREAQKKYAKDMYNYVKSRLFLDFKEHGNSTSFRDEPEHISNEQLSICDKLCQSEIDEIMHSEPLTEEEKREVLTDIKSIKIVTLNILSPVNGQTKKTIEVTDDNRDLIDKWLYKEMNSVFCVEVYNEGKPQYYYVKKEQFDALKSEFDIL